MVIHYHVLITDISQKLLKKEISDILKDADLENTSGKMVRCQLEENLDCYIIYREKEVDELILEVIDDLSQNNDQEKLRTEIKEILKDADLEKTSAKMVRLRLQLEEKLGCSLIHRKKEIDKLIIEQIQNDEDENKTGNKSESEEDNPILKRRHINDLLFQL